MAQNPSEYDSNNITRLVFIDYNFNALDETYYEEQWLESGHAVIGARNIPASMNIKVLFDPEEIE